MLGYDDPRVYFAVPDHYTIGREFETLPEALDFARSTVRPLDGLDRYSRAFVNIRIADSTGDRQVHRIEVFQDGWAHVLAGQGGIDRSALEAHQLRLNAWAEKRTVAA